MAIFNGSRMVALFLFVLFALNASFAQNQWETVVVYMEDPIEEEVSQGVEEYLEKWNDPLTWETFERDFTPAREAQLEQVRQDNAARILAAEEFLRDDLLERGDGTSKWYPSWIPLLSAETTEDSLFKNILSLPGRTYDTGPRAGQAQSLLEFFERDGSEPFGLNPDGTQKERTCDETRRRCRKEFYTDFRALVEVHDESKVSADAPRVISFTIEVQSSTRRDTTVVPGGFVDELNEEISDPSTTTTRYALFNWDTIRLLQPAEHDPDEYVIDLSPYWQPAAKPAASAEASSWGRIKATFADD